MRCINKIGFALVLWLCLMFNIKALGTVNDNDGFLYGGQLNDILYDIDFFSDGKYVVVGETKSTFREIVNNDTSAVGTDGVVAIFDKDNKLLKEFSWNNNDGQTIESFNAVKVIDDNSFLVCGLTTTTPHCMKYNLSGELIWEVTLGTDAVEDEDAFDIFMTSDNRFIVSCGSVTSKIFIINNDGTDVQTVQLAENGYSDVDVKSITEYNGKYILAGDKNFLGSTAFTILNQDGTIADQVTFGVDTSSVIEDVKVYGDNLVITVNTGVCNSNCEHVFGKDSNQGSIALIDSSYKVKKYTEFGVVTSHSSLQILEDGTIAVTINSAGTDSYVNYYDKDLNLLASKKYKGNTNVRFNKTAINPLNKQLYIVGSLQGSYGDLTAAGESDGLVLAVNMVPMDDASHEAVDPTPEVPSVEPVAEQPQQQKKEDNPKTGAFVTVGVITLLVIMTIVVLVKGRIRGRIFNI